jgi:hypothetical protein
VDHSEDDPTAASTDTSLVLSGGTAYTGPSEYDYEAHPPDLASDARQAAERIRVLLGTQQKAIVETGLELIAMENKLRGRFLKWIEEALDMSDKTAERYMRVASHFGTRIDTVSNLQRITLYKLTERSTPAPVSAEVLALLDSRLSVTDREVHTRIAAAKNQREPTQKKVRQANAKQAAEMLAARLGSDLGRFLELAKDLSLKEILDNLAASSWENTPQPSAGLTPLPMASLWDAQASKAENA